MKTVKILPLGLVSVLLALNSCTARPSPSTTQAVSSQPPAAEFSTNRLTLRIPASDARFCYEGRFNFSDSNAPVVIWQASRISLDFSGDALTPLFDDAKGQCFFNATVDGSNTVIEVREGQPVGPATLTGFGSGRHHLELFKRSEADAGTVRFRGVELPGGAQAWAPATLVYRLRMEFFGDSITINFAFHKNQTPLI